MRIEAPAMISGRTASQEPKTRARTISAPSAPTAVSTSRPAPPPPESSESASTPVTRNGAPPTDCFAAAACIAVRAASFLFGAGWPSGG